ncbi:putative two-component membrane permease complex subunit SMU_747c [Rubritalea halochordaticola]|uniref:Two-component membrane permease complex subunit SMU_747c n=1 Tax=Rubritalea halochordaticola TaxID=714537 RepID=A0ABP9UV84_9BACT
MESFSHSTFAYYFLSLLMEGAPFILLGTLISGFIDVYMPSGMLEKLLPKKRLPAVLVCGLLGVILPVCECAVVPVIRRLVAKGLPVSCAFTYMLAAPIVNPVTILSTWSAFSDQQALYMTLSRIGMGYLIAVLVGVIVMFVPIEKILKKSLLKTVSKASKEDSHGESSECCGGHNHHHHDHSEHACCGSDHDHDKCSHDHHENCGHDHHDHAEKHRIVAAMRSGMKDFVDVAVYFTIGVCLTSMFNIMQVDYSKQIDSFAGDPVKGTGLLMVLAFVLSVCSTSDAFLAASLGKFSYASKMAFMVFGPMLDVKLLFLYQTVMRKKFLAVFAISLFIIVGAICLLWAQWDGLFEWCRSLEASILSEGGGR